MDILTDWMLTLILAGLCLTMIAQGLIKREKLFELPFLMGAITFVFIMPQLPGLLADRYIPAGDYAKAIVFTVFCILAAWIGWVAPKKPFSILRGTLDRPTLIFGAAVMSLIGSVFYYQLSQQPGEMQVAAGQTGLPVMQIFLSRYMVYGLGVALLCFAQRPSWTTAAIIVFDAAFYLHSIVVTGKRGEAFEFVILLVLAFWFRRRRILLPRLAVMAGLLVGIVGMSSAGEYRNISRTEREVSLASLAEINWLEGVRDGLERGGLEMRNAISVISFVDRTMEFDYGIFHWNVLIYNFVPAQLVGHTAKASLMIASPRLEDRDYAPVFGTTETGMSDAFSSFWYFGCFKFMLISALLSRVYRTAMSGESVAQLVYMFSVTPAMHTISHHTQWIFSAWVQLMIFVLPVLLVASRPGRSRNAAVPA